MQLAGLLFTKLIGGIASTAGAAGATATGLSSLQGITTLFGAVATIGSGVAAYQAGKAEEKQQLFESRNEFIEGRETSAALKEELARTVSNQAVAFASGGASLDSISVQAARKQATADAETELETNTIGSATRMLQRRRAARDARARGSAALFSSVAEAGGQIAKFKAGQ